MNEGNKIVGDVDRRDEEGRSFQNLLSRFAVILNVMGNYWRAERRNNIILMT